MKCKGTNKDGSACGNSARTFSLYCHTHRDSKHQIYAHLLAVFAIAISVYGIYDVRESRAADRQAELADREMSNRVEERFLLEKARDLIGGMAIAGPISKFSADREVQMQVAQLIQEARKFVPNSHRAYRIEGHLREGQGQTSMALDAYRKAIEIAKLVDQRAEPAIARSIGQYHGDRGRVYNLLRRHADAVHEFELAVGWDPESAVGHNGIGNARLSLGSYEVSLESFGKAIEIDPDFTYAYNGKGNALTALNRLDEALKEFDRAIELDDGYADAWNGRALCLFRLGRLDESLEAFAAAVKRDPDVSTYHSGMAGLLNVLGRRSEAIVALDRAIEIDPKLASNHYLAGIMKKESGDWEGAVRSFGECVKLDPNTSFLRRSLAEALHATGRHDEAAQAEKAASELDQAAPEGQKDAGAK